MRIVMVFGAFDGLHPGHMDFFRQAKKYGEFLIVSVGLDEVVKSIKGKKPLFSQDERLRLVSAIRIVDKAVLGAKKDFYEHIREFSPNVICLGYDQWASESDVRRELDKIGLADTSIVRLKPYKVRRAKSTILKKKSLEFKGL